MRNLIRCIALISAAAGLSEAGVIYTYQEGPDAPPYVDNFHSGLIAQDSAGTPNPGPVDFWWASQFFTVPGGEKITSITLGFDDHLPKDFPISFLVYSDQNGTGQADSLQLLGQVSGTVPAFANAPFAVLTYMTLTFPTPIQVGSSFFIAGLVKNIGPTAPCVPGDPVGGVCVPSIEVDLNKPQGHSWFGQQSTNPNTFNPSDPVASSEGGLTNDPTFNWTLSANAIPGVAASVPEPASLLLVGGGLLALVARRRRAQSR